MKYILSVLYKALIFITFSILAIIVQICSIIWNCKFKSIANPNCVPIWYNNGYKLYYNSLWDVSIGRISFIREGFNVGTRYVYNSKYRTYYPTVRGKTKPFTYKV